MKTTRTKITLDAGAFVIALLPTMLCSSEAPNFLAFCEILTRPKLPFDGLLTLLFGPQTHFVTGIPRATLQDHSNSSFKCLLDCVIVVADG
jgi:hypothetical protein